MPRLISLDYSDGVNQRLASAAASSVCGSTVSREVTSPLTENTALIPSAVGASCRRFSLASRRSVSPSQVNWTRTRWPWPMARHWVSSSEVNGEFFKGVGVGGSLQGCGALGFAALLLALYLFRVALFLIFERLQIVL